MLGFRKVMESAAKRYSQNDVRQCEDKGMGGHRLGVPGQDYGLPVSSTKSAETGDREIRTQAAELAAFLH